MPDRRRDFQTRDRLTDIALGYDAFVARVSWLLRAFVALFFVAAALFTYLLAVSRDQAADARRVAAQTRALSHQIQRERARSVRATCAEQNARHDGAIATLAAIDRQLRMASPQDRAQLRAYRRFSASLIEALAPRRDCADLVTRTVGQPP